jgi:hypothetical protein
VSFSAEVDSRESSRKDKTKMLDNIYFRIYMKLSKFGRIPFCLERFVALADAFLPKIVSDDASAEADARHYSRI